MITTVLFPLPIAGRGSPKRDMDDPREAYRRYAGMIRAMIARQPRFTFSAENATAVQVERGVVFARAIYDGSLDTQNAVPAERLIELATAPRLGELAIVDACGHHRPVYRGLLVYSWLQTFRLVYEQLPQSQFGRWEEGLRAWCDLLEAQLGEIELPRGTIPAARGASATEAALLALALQVAGKVFVRDAWIDLASDLFGRITGAQDSLGGAFLAATGSDNPETRGYHELVLLHACASYAVQTEDRRLAGAVARSTEFHLRESQPDHATSHPWGLFAFIWNSSTHSMADQLLHATSVRGAESLDGISLMLLADALYCLRLFVN